MGQRGTTQEPYIAADGRRKGVSTTNGHASHEVGSRAKYIVLSCGAGCNQNLYV